MRTLTQPKHIDGTLEWPGPGEYGIVPIDSLVPNPNNPRKHFDDDETASLAVSIRKGGKREITTVRMLSEREKAHYAAEYPNGRYMITSGGRRHLASLKAGLQFSDVRVKEYIDDGDEELDMYMLNEDRIGLSDLENAWAIDSLRRKKGWDTIEEIADNINKSTAFVSQTLALLKCIPEVQAKLHPSIKYHARMRRPVGVFLSRRPAEIQKDLIERMPPELKTSTTQLAWLQRQEEQHGLTLKHRARNPKTMRSVLEALGTNVFQRANHFNHAKESERLFDNTNDTDALALARHLRRALTAFETAVARVEVLAKSEKRISPTLTHRSAQEREARGVPLPSASGVRAVPRSEAVAKLMEVRTAGAAPKPVPTSAVARATPASSPPVIRPFAAGKATIASRPMTGHPSILSPSESSRGRKVNVRYKNGDGKIVAETVTLRRFMELWDEKALEFQVNGEPRPSNYPDRRQLSG